METGQEYIGSKKTHPVFGNMLKDKVASGIVGSWKKIKG